MENKYLNHYTSIECLLEILGSKSLLLSDPEQWSDKNDAASIEAFCLKKGEGIKARVICFAQEGEEIHHWNSYAKKGCCINFNKEILFKDLDDTHFLHNPIIYKSINKKEDEDFLSIDILRGLDTNDLPFLKHKAYSCENEYRVVWFGLENEAKEIKIQSIDTAIRRIILAPSLKCYEELKKCLEERYHIERVFLSHIEESKKWIDKFKKIANNSTQEEKYEPTMQTL
jgi:hypothetical protein